MRAVRYIESGIRVVDVPAPSGPGVRVRVRSASVCGSDLHLLGQVHGVTLGHEIAGITPDGSPVAIEPLSPCLRCEQCQLGSYHLCVEAKAMIHGVGRDGGMADEILVPERALVPLPNAVALADACLVEPLAVVVHGIRRSGLRAGDRVAVIGGGPLGLCAIAVLRAFGAGEVALIARHDTQRAAGERLGAVPAKSGHYDLVIEAAGSQSAFAQAVETVRPHGKIAVIGTYWDPIQIPGFELAMKEADLSMSVLYSGAPPHRDVDRAAALLAATPELPRAVITHRFPLDAAREAFAMAADRKAGAIKVVLEP